MDFLEVVDVDFEGVMMTLGRDESSLDHRFNKYYKDSSFGR